MYMKWVWNVYEMYLEYSPISGKKRNWMQYIQKGAENTKVYYPNAIKSPSECTSRHYRDIFRNHQWKNAEKSLNKV